MSEQALDLQAYESAEGGCVIAVIDYSSEPKRYSSSIEIQEIAMKQQLPLAFVCSLLPEELNKYINKLAAIERLLQKRNIPLIVLLGEPDVVLQALFHHTKPLKVVSVQADTLGLHELVLHPRSWPGTVIPTSELLKIAQNPNSTCF